MGCDQLLRNDVNCTDVFRTGVDASGAISCAALTATGTVAGATLLSTGAVSGSSLSITGTASVGLLSSATGITGSTLTINNTANAGNFTTVGDVYGRHADDHRGKPGRGRRTHKKHETNHQSYKDPRRRRGRGARRPSALSCPRTQLSTCA